jgi:outer membrane protein OmpA-like peptidoglycan-associated protein/uncharacterized protein YuzE
MRANHLERAGVIGTPCRECEEQVYVETDEEGYVIGITVGEEPASESEEAETATSLLRPTIVGPLALLAGIVFIAWIASSTYCARALPARTATQASGPVTTPTPTPVSTPAPSPTRLPLPKVLVFDNQSGIKFAPNQTALPAAAQTVLVDVAERLKAAPAGALFEIGGHTDNRGSESYNKRLSLQRAESVRQFLVKQGVPAALLQVKGYGGAKSRASNESEEGKEQNRRIEITRVK